MAGADKITRQTTSNRVLAFTKMHGLGNDFVMVDAIRQDPGAWDLSALARQVNDRRFGVGGDGLILALPGDDVPFRMRMFNPDGSESEMCGNGVRCFARFLREQRHTSDTFIPVETGAGCLSLEVLPDERVRVDMGPYRLTRGEIGMVGAPTERFIEGDLDFEGLFGTAVSMGNPHLVIFLDDIDSVRLSSWGPLLEHHRLFPNRVNVHFVQRVSETRLRQRTWERGAGATLACGTGACAVAVAGWLTHRSHTGVTIELPGGDLDVEVREGHAHMTGPATTVFTGEWPLT